MQLVHTIKSATERSTMVNAGTPITPPSEVLSTLVSRFLNQPFVAIVVSRRHYADMIAVLAAGSRSDRFKIHGKADDITQFEIDPIIIEPYTRYARHTRIERNVKRIIYLTTSTPSDTMPIIHVG